MNITDTHLKDNRKMPCTKIKNKKIPEYTSVQACKILGVSRPQLYLMIQEGEIIPDSIIKKPENSRVTYYHFSQKTLDNWKKQQEQYIGVREAAKELGVCMRTLFLMIYDEKLIPDKTVMNRKKTGKKLEIHKYLFSRKTIKKYIEEQEKWIPTVKVCEILKLSRRQVYLLIYSGRLIPDRTEKITKGKRGSFFAFFFLRKTLDNFLKATENDIKSEKNGNASE